MDRKIRSQCIDDAREFLPCTLYILDEDLSPKCAGIVKFASAHNPIGAEVEDTPFRSDFEGDSGDLFGELAEFIHHGVNYVLELHHDGPLHGNGDLLSEVAICDGLADSCNVLNLGL